MIEWFKYHFGVFLIMPNLSGLKIDYNDPVYYAENEKLLGLLSERGMKYAVVLKSSHINDVMYAIDMLSQQPAIAAIYKMKKDAENAAASRVGAYWCTNQSTCRVMTVSGLKRIITANHKMPKPRPWIRILLDIESG